MTPSASRVNDPQDLHGANEAPNSSLQPPAGQPNMPAPMKPSQSGHGALRAIVRVIPVVLLAVVAIGLIVVWIQRDLVLDKIRLYGYQPTSDVIQLAEDTAMTDYATRLFLVNRPSVEDRDAFNQHCSDVDAIEVAVLGCYRGNRQGIYMYNVTDDRLAGIEEVTAAHEMLHQAYDRLSLTEKSRINTQLENYAATITEGPLHEKLEAYRKLASVEMPNEMHSIFGTEAATLPAELEKYYTRYFTDRSKVLALQAHYRAAFDERTKQIAAYDSELEVLQDEVTERRKQLAESESSLKIERERMNDLLDDDRIAEYNAAVPTFNAQVERYKRDVAVANEKINRYNAVIDARNKIAVEERELLKAQDSHADSAGTQ